MDFDPVNRLITNDAANKLLLFNEKLRELDREVPGQVVAPLLYIASRNNCHKIAIEEDLEFSTASISRNIQRLEGFGLVEKYQEEGSRRLLCKLTAKGKVFTDQLLSIIYD